jgi:hypothetical protein
MLARVAELEYTGIMEKLKALDTCFHLRHDQAQFIPLDDAAQAARGMPCIISLKTLQSVAAQISECALP